LLPTGNLFSFSAFSLVAECAGIYFGSLAHLRPEDGLPFPRFFGKVFLHDESPPLN
jgi:hypothetical protein